MTREDLKRIAGGEDDSEQLLDLILWATGPKTLARMLSLKKSYLDVEIQDQIDAGYIGVDLGLGVKFARWDRIAESNEVRNLVCKADILLAEREQICGFEHRLSEYRIQKSLE